MHYRPDLDGSRALAVLASRTGVSIAGGGWMGVDVFFVLSGYLITTQPAREDTRSATVGS